MSAGNVAVVDSWAILAFLRAEEPGAAAMRRFLRRAQSGNLRLLLNVVTLGEVFYRLIQLTDFGRRSRPAPFLNHGSTKSSGQDQSGRRWPAEVETVRRSRFRGGLW